MRRRASPQGSGLAKQNEEGIHVERWPGMASASEERRGGYLFVYAHTRACVCLLRRPGFSSTSCLQILELGLLGEINGCF